MSNGAGIFFDGETSARREVSVALAPEALVIADARGDELAEWPYADIEQLSAPSHLLRLGLRGEPVLARLEIHDPAFAAAIDHRALTVDRSGSAGRRERTRVILWSVVATLSLVAAAVFVLPELAARLAPLIPAGVESRLGAAVDAQVRAMLDDRKLGDRLVCGIQAAERPGQAALDAMVAKLTQAAALPVKLHVIRREEPNAIALPGGHIYVFQGLLAKATSADEIAAVIAHEIGHVAHRDGTRAMLQAAGLSLMFGMLLGDFVGGGAVVLAGKALLQSSYSREVELAADAYGTRLMAQVGGDARALVGILTRIEGERRPGTSIWVDHPDAQARARAIIALAPPASGAPLLDAEQWAALRRICTD